MNNKLYYERQVELMETRLHSTPNDITAKDRLAFAHAKLGNIKAGLNIAESEKTKNIIIEIQKRAEGNTNKV